MAMLLLKGQVSTSLIFTYCAAAVSHIDMGLIGTIQSSIFGCMKSILRPLFNGCNNTFDKYQIAILPKSHIKID